MSQKASNYFRLKINKQIGILLLKLSYVNKSILNQYTTGKFI